MQYGNIIGTGAYLPEIEVTNDMLRKRLAHEPGFVDKMEASTGIRTRWYAPEGWATSDLALKAAEKALANAGRTASDLDLIILGTDSPDYITPATSVVLQDKLGARNAGTFDVGCACASFPTGLAIASGLLATNQNLKTILVVGAYMMHKLADPNEKSIFFYGDGAGAAIWNPQTSRASSPRHFKPMARTQNTGASMQAEPLSRPAKNPCKPGVPWCVPSRGIHPRSTRRAGKSWCAT
jgi:3-oxoacyl-[acyl-carrier-protein] synthase-3